MANPTIKDVAREAGVSIATVSRVLNKKGTVKEASVQSVLQAIERLGYHPNSIARALKNDSSKTIGLVVTDISNDFFTRMARGIEDVLNDRGYNLFVCSTDGLQQREAQCLSLLREKQVDGIILNASGKNSNLITKMSSQVPFALFSRKIPDPQFRGDFVDNDNYSGLRELTAQLLRLGHRKIGFINGQSYVSSAAERFSGFQSAMRDAGIDVGTDYPYLYSGNFNRLNSGKEGARVLWEKGVTAILCGNNLLALGALQYCKEAGLRLPEDLSLCSFGTLANQDLLFVRPTSCEQNPDAMGARLAELIIERIESKNQIPNREIRFTTTILPGNGPIRSNYNDEIIIKITSNEKVDVDIEKLINDNKIVGIIVNDKVIYGENDYIEKVNNYLFKVNINSFFQVNLNILEKIEKILHAKKYHNVVDLYCGVGTLGMFVNKDKLYGIEIVKDAVINASINAKINKQNNMYMLGDSSKISKINSDIDCIIIDPPRSGLNKETMKNIVTIKPDNLIYMSCNPLTFVRDMQILNKIYNVDEFYYLEMFPRTKHTEVLCTLKKK